MSPGAVEVFTTLILLGDSRRTRHYRHDNWAASRPNRCLASFPRAGVSATLHISVAAEVAIAVVSLVAKHNRADYAWNRGALTRLGYDGAFVSEARCPTALHGSVTVGVVGTLRLDGAQHLWTGSSWSTGHVGRTRSRLVQRQALRPVALVCTARSVLATGIIRAVLHLVRRTAGGWSGQLREGPRTHVGTADAARAAAFVAATRLVTGTRSVVTSDMVSCKAYDCRVGVWTLQGMQHDEGVRSSSQDDDEESGRES